MLGQKQRKFRRFSLLLMDEGEYYFDDLQAFAYGGVDADPRAALRSRSKGRVKLCSKSLFFVPDDEDECITRYLFRDISDMAPCWVGVGAQKTEFECLTVRSVIGTKHAGADHQ